MNETSSKPPLGSAAGALAVSSAVCGLVAFPGLFHGESSFSFEIGPAFDRSPKIVEPIVRVHRYLPPVITFIFYQGFAAEQDNEDFFDTCELPLY